jgi:hypothetical protein
MMSLEQRYGTRFVEGPKPKRQPSKGTGERAIGNAVVM